VENEKPLTKAEERVMRALWMVGKGVLREVVDAMPDPKPHSNTVATVLKILTDKGYVNVEPVGRINLYSPKVSIEEYSKRSISQLAVSYFGGSLSSMVSFLVDSKEVSINDLEQLIQQFKK
jgi:predicted transcriptional regulator